MFSIIVAAVLAYPTCEVVEGDVTGNHIYALACPNSYAAGPGACSAGQYVTGLNANGTGPTCDTPSPGAFTVGTSTSSRTLNTDFTPSASKPVFVTYSVQIDCTASLAGGQNSTIELRSDTSTTPTTVRSTAKNGNTVALAIALTVVNSQTIPISYVVPIGHKVRLSTSTTGTACTTSIISQSEVTLG